MIAQLGVTARWAGGPNQLLVLAARHDAAGRLWVRVRLAQRPNNANAWIRADRTVLDAHGGESRSTSATAP